MKLKKYCKDCREKKESIFRTIYLDYITKITVDFVRRIRFKRELKKESK